MTRRRRRGPLWLVYKSFDRIRHPLAWVELTGGFVATILTLAGVMPPVGDTLLGKVIASLLWWQLAKEGFGVIHDELGDEYDTASPR